MTRKPVRLDDYYIDGECHEWTRARFGSGYGKMWVDGRDQYAHRVAYAFYVGDIPEGMVVHHTCENKACINPEHLALSTRAEHVREHRGKDTCRKGHTMIDAYVHPGSGLRRCRTCRDEYRQAYTERTGR